jgi:hypothetical protein
MIFLTRHHGNQKAAKCRIGAANSVGALPPLADEGQRETRSTLRMALRL